MKKMKILLIFACFLTIFVCGGCGKTELESAKITRDDERVGGSLSFVYDPKVRKIYIGGEDEVVQFSSTNELRGLSEGNRIGLKVSAPNEKLDLSNATLEMNGINYPSGGFLESINGQKQRFFNIYPLVTKENKTICFKVTWQEKSKEQEYKVVVVDGTKFMDKDGKVE